jgi:hypothetical protein
LQAGEGLGTISTPGFGAALHACSISIVRIDQFEVSSVARRKRPQSPAEIDRHLQEQIAFLDKSRAAYDSGDETEAKRLASSVRLLVHDTSHSTSLLRSAGLKGIRFLDSADDILPRNHAPSFGLVVMRLGPGWNRYCAPLRQTRAKPVWFVKFHEWWDRVVIHIPDQFSLTRRDLVLTMANQDGGAHVDTEIDEDYYRLTRENALGITIPTPVGGAPLSDIETASVRQIAEELRASLELRQTTIAPNLESSREVYCPCKSGLSYSQCHKEGGVNVGT